jgi:hypothetical protein
MTNPLEFTPYSTLAIGYFPSTKPSWVPDDLDQARVMSYKVYEQMYWTAPNTFTMVARGTEDKPIYLPSARVVVDTTNRYTATKMTFSAMPVASAQLADGQLTAAHQYFDDMLTRERFWSKFAGNKRYGLIRGDWAFHLSADPTKPQGSRISIHALDPGTYFPIPDPNDVERNLGCYIAQQIVVGTDTLIKRTAYYKSDYPKIGKTAGGQISYEVTMHKADDWYGDDAKAESTPTPLTPLPITTLPVYHIKNFDEPGNPFGSSELRGLERLMAALNQGISDEELTLALDGLGMYATDAPAPRDSSGNETDWVLGPGRVLETPNGTNFNRVSGVGSDAVSAMRGHLDYLGDWLTQSAATPPVARGSVDVSIAQSGIALYLEMSPLLAKTDEKDIGIREVMSQMFYDLTTQWLPTYEGVGSVFSNIAIKPVFGDKMPVDREKFFAELDKMLTENVISAAYYREQAAKFGYVFPEGIGLDIIEEQAAMAEAQDPFGQRLANEAGVGNVDTSSGQATSPGVPQNSSSAGQGPSSGVAGSGA